MTRLSILAFLATLATVSAGDIDLKRLDRIDTAVEDAIAKRDCPGAVVVVLQADEVVYRKAFGKRDANTPMTVDTLFDLASLTKPVATATSVMVLIERGELRLSDKVSKYWPEFAANEKGDVTIEQCLVHTSGLTADNPIADYANGRNKAFENIAALKLEAPPGTRFKYSDVGYLVLGEVVQRVGKRPFQEFVQEQVFAPLKLTHTGYLPKETERALAAPTGERDGKEIRGVVHDPRAYAIDGVAGHAGLFSTADDLTRYCRMLLRGGDLGGERVLSPLAVKLFTEGRELQGGAVRSPGWDVDTGYTSQRGELFPAGEGFGHTGFTGTSIWVDPPSRTAIIILTNRTQIGGKASVTELRRKVGTIVAAAITHREPTRPTPGSGR